MPCHLLSTSDEAGTHAAGMALASLLEPGDVVVLCGDLGAGKTQLVKGIAAGLGVREPVTSPTFNILLVHEGRLALYHVDLFRFERAEQLDDIDFYGTIDAGGVTVVEWGDRFPEVESVAVLQVRLSLVSDTERLIEVTPRGPRGRELVRAWRDACAGLTGVAVFAEADS